MLQESCYHVLANNAGKVRTGCKIIPRVNLKGDTNAPRVQRGLGNEQISRYALGIDRLVRVGPSDPKRMFGIERLKKLGATMFKGFTNSTDIEVWLNMLEKCFDVMSYP
ncbi:uncharacterized protein E5676_scaffold73G00350 [Cucumis melo var. makuwa]|uniref:Uncharacterized protein n=1 Tax=Cucumis melo var. makuwa TaxID=1194695 RepID=A0A5D3CIC7_CUCMM|nr:uncharacterized protein E5676_scaffold73G00350 [Cucumis melo var. makuwa]